MEGNGKMSTNLEYIKSQLDEESKVNIQNLLDRVLLTILLDSKKHNDESLKIIEPIFDSKQEIDKINVDDRTLMKLAYTGKA
jgi:hypothetical protein